MREQSKLRQADPAPGVQLRGWAAAVAALRADRDLVEFEVRKAAIVAALRRLAGSYRATR